MKILAIIFGVLTTILGFCALGMPLRMFLWMGWLLGAVLLVNGIVLAVNAFSKKKDVWEGVLGILIAVGGGIILFNTASRVMTDVLLAYLSGFVVVVCGVNLIIAAIKGMKQSKVMGILGILCGVLAILAGMFAAVHPVITMISLGYIIGFSVVMQGINTILLGCSMKGTDK